MPKTLALSAHLRVAVLRLARRLRTERGDHDLSLSQLAALSTLERHGPLTPGELAAHEKIRPPSMSRLLAGLAQRGLIDRTGHPRDGRQVLVAATAQALLLLREDRRRRDAWLARRLAALEPEEREILRRAAEVLERMAAS